MPRLKEKFKFEPDQEVIDQRAALKIQLEMLKQRTDLALKAMRDGHNRELQDHIGSIRSISTRVHNLGYLAKPSDDQRLLSMINECRYTTETTSELYRDEGLIYLSGMYDIKKMSRRFLW